MDKQILSDFDFERIQHFFSAAFKIKSRTSDLAGLTVEAAKRIIANEFDFVENGEAALREYESMLSTHFIRAGVTGIKANINLEKEYNEFMCQFQ